MPAAYKVLGQSNPAANTLTTLFTASTQAVASTLAIANLGTSTTYRVAVRPAGASIANQHWIVWDAALNANDSVFLTLGISLASSDVVSVQTGGSVAFSLFGTEIT